MERKVPVLISSARIKTKTQKLAAQISRDYQHKNPLIVCVLKSAFVFTADLLRYLSIPARCDFVMISTYGSRIQSSGKIKMTLDLAQPVRGKNIIIIEDIVDTGLTLKHLKDKLLARKPKSVRICTLLDKPSRRKTKIKLDYVGFKIPNRFVVGYGIDFNEQYRHLPYVGYIK